MTSHPTRFKERYYGQDNFPYHMSMGIIILGVIVSTILLFLWIRSI